MFFLFSLTLRKIRSNEIVFVPFESIKLRETRTILTTDDIMVIPHPTFFSSFGPGANIVLNGKY